MWLQLQLTLRGGVFSINGSEAVVDSFSTFLTEHQSGANTEQDLVRLPAAISVIAQFYRNNYMSAIPLSFQSKYPTVVKIFLCSYVDR